MTVPPDSPRLDPLLDEALEWVALLKAGEPTRADAEALQRWRKQSPDHEAAFKAAVRIFRNAGLASQELATQELAAQELAAQELAAQELPAQKLPVRERAAQQRADGPSAIDGARSARLRRLSRRMVLGGAIAAAGAGYAIIRPPLGLWPSLQELSADYRTAKGEQRKVAVAPDVSLELNTQTSVALRSAQSETEVELISGEASIEAARAASNPFILLAANGRISATRAAFNVRCLDGVVTATCLTGAIDVARDGKTARLQKAEQISYSPAGLQASVPVDPAQIIAWQAGLLIFRDRPLTNVVDEVNRYRSGKIIVTNENLRRRIVNGTFRIDKLEDFVAQVQQLFGAQVRYLPGGVVLLS